MKSSIAGPLLAIFALANLSGARVAADPAVQSARKLKVVIFGGHPDDPESGAGGLAALLRQGGHEVILAYGTAFRGDRRFFERPEAEVRQGEATAACKLLGATPKFFPYAHEKLVADAATLNDVSKWLDQTGPDTCSSSRRRTARSCRFRSARASDESAPKSNAGISCPAPVC